MFQQFICNIISKELPEDLLVIFVKAHNNDVRCIESLSLEITRSTLETAPRIMNVIENKAKSKIHKIERELRKEYDLKFKRWMW